MKSKFILAASVAAMLVASAQAETVVITGATSFRSVIHASIAAQYPNAKIAYFGAAKLADAGEAVYTSGADTVIVKFSGSVEGIRELDGSRTMDVINPTSFTPPTSTGTGNAKLLTDTDFTRTSLVPDAALSDVYQASTSYRTKKLVDTKVGVMPFVWVINKVGKDQGITNITAQLANAVLQDGGVTASKFTGNSADENPVFATGRDAGSGTRMTALKEIKYAAGTAVNQYLPTISGGTITSLDLWPSPDGGITADGDYGYTSGGNVFTAINSPVDAAIADNVLISYIAYSDTIDSTTGVSKLTNGGLLTYNGVAYSANAVKIGAYTFWGYEHLFTPQGGLTGTKKTIVDNIVGKIPANIGLKGIKLSDMSVSRGADGAYVF